MKKIGVIFILFGFFFPIVLFLYTDFGTKGISLETVRAAEVINLTEPVYYTKEEWKEITIESEESLKKLKDKLKRGEELSGLEELYLKYPPKYSNIPGIKKYPVTIYYIDCLAGSIIIFAIGLGFLLLGKRPSRKKGGETEKI